MAKFQWALDEEKFLSRKEVKKLSRYCRIQARRASKSGRKIPIKDWFIIDLALSTGLRVSEIANLKCGDIHIDDDRSSLLVRNGKNSKPRIVRFALKFKEHMEEYLRWKGEIRESTDVNAPLIYSRNSRGHITKRAIQKTFNRCTRRAGITNHSIHHARHTYATALLRASKNNLVLVKNQLGHSSIKTTEIYLHVTNQDLDKALKRLYC